MHASRGEKRYERPIWTKFTGSPEDAELGGKRANGKERDAFLDHLWAIQPTYSLDGMSNEMAMKCEIQRELIHCIENGQCLSRYDICKFKGADKPKSGDEAAPEADQKVNLPSMVDFWRQQVMLKAIAHSLRGRINERAIETNKSIIE